ncbi:MAG: DNA-3-methyladenine glycosylase family protein [Frankiaceae bacterium]
MVPETLRLPVPYDGDRVLRYLAGRAIPGVEEVANGTYRRTIAVADSAAVLALRPGTSHVALSVTGAGVDDALASRARRLLDLDTDPVEIATALGADPVLAPLVAARPGLRVPGAYDGFELAVRALLGQQVTVRGASTLAGRLVSRAGRPLPASPGGTLTHLFPRPAEVAAAELGGIGMPGRRIAALQGLARAVAGGAVQLDGTTDRDATCDALLALPGIGRWTVDYLAMRAMGDRDAFPAGDLGLRRAAAALGLPVRERALRAHAERWRPWRAYAAMHLWTWATEDGPERRYG